MSALQHLLSRMTLEEKLGQLTMTASGQTVTGPFIAGDSTESIRSGALGNLLNLHGAAAVHDMQGLAVRESRLGIPLLFGLDVIHGHRQLFPIPLAETGIFDPAAWEASARAAAQEAATDGIALTFAPMLDVSRDPRWGRTAEGPGEDPWVAAQLAWAKIRGFQGSSLADPTSVAACAKHYCAYGPVTAGREYASVDISDRTLHEVHLVAFEAAVDAGVASIMPAFTDLAGVPMTAHGPLLQDHLRGRLGFRGVVISDYNAIGELIRHGVASDLAEAAALALRAGVDIDMMAEAYRRGLPIALQRGLVDQAMIDAAVLRVLQLKERLGLFDDPFARGSAPARPGDIAGWRSLARNLGSRCAVMLKNTAQTLPLPLDSGRIALIGPLADAAVQMRGPWWAAGVAENHVSVLEGLRHAVGANADLRCAQGVPLEETARLHPGEAQANSGWDPSERLTQWQAALELCGWADHVVLCLGEAASMSGEAASRANPDLPGRQEALAAEVIRRAHERGVRVTLLLFCGRPLMLRELIESSDAVLLAWFAGCEAGHALADVLSGQVEPEGRLAISWPYGVGQVPVFYGQRPGGRPQNPADFYTSKYLDIPNEPLFAFGHGLGYASFDVGQPQVSPSIARVGDTLTISLDLHNPGGRDGLAILFVFARDLVASVSRPVLQLVASHRCQVAAGATVAVRIALEASQFRFLGADLKPVFEAGEVDLLVGLSAERSALKACRVVLA